jgi:ElaB/YqjD/DUF883 family membrane-anchored ribosome-binding protein
MKAATLTQAGEQVKDGLTDLSDRVKEFSGNINERWKDTRDDLQRRVRKIKTATEDRMEEARHRIKADPLKVVAAVASGAFLLGVITGWAASKARR